MPNPVAFFMARLILGVACFGWTFSSDRFRVVSPFFRILMLLLLGLAIVFGLTMPRDATGLLSLLIVPASFFGSAFWLLEKRGAARALFLVCAGLSLLWLGISTWTFAGGETSKFVLCSLSFLASTATLGTALCGMLLGHRYLTAPGMPLEPLQVANSALGAAGLVRLAASVGALAMGWSMLGGASHLTWFALRWLAGVIGPLGVAFMVRRILVYRNTQAATGVLFVGVILTFIGELTGDVLFRSLGMPF